MDSVTLITPAHDKDMAKDFLAGLDPSASKFTFQFFSDRADRYAEIFHGTIDEVWPKVQTLNTPQRDVGVIVTINETDFKGRRSKNIVRTRALYVDADSNEQIERCIEAIKACGISPSMAVKTGRGMHIYFCTDVPLSLFRDLQESLINKLGTDPAVKDLSRVMRLPGTLHLKDPTKPWLVKLYPTKTPVPRWNFFELIARLGLSPAKAVPNQGQQNAATLMPFNNELSPSSRERLKKLFGHLPVESLSEGLETNIEEIRSAVSAIPSLAISTELEWMRFARGLAHEAAVHKDRTEPLWEILDTASRPAPGYDEADNRSRWLRYIDEAFNRENPITIATVFDLAKKYGWQGWSPPVTATTSMPAVWSSAGLKVSFSNIPHRQWLYGTYLIRGEITVSAAPGGAGKTAHATGMAVEIATGKGKLGEKVWRNDDQRVLYINGEDSSTEIQRRILAFCQQHKVEKQDLDRLYVAAADDPRVQSLSFLSMNEKGTTALDNAGFGVLETALQSLRPDLLILDPLVVFCGGGNMNDNAVMSLVVRKLKSLAVKYDCAILIVHHTRKGGRGSASAGEAEEISGAAAIVNLARRAIMPVTMTDAETKTFGVLPSERRQYFKLADAKSNLAPLLSEAPWYELASEELPNAEPPTYPHGDRVQAVKRAQLTRSKVSSFAGPEQETIRFEILKLIDRGLTINGEKVPYSPNSTGNNKQRAILADAIAAVEQVTEDREWLPRDLRAVVEREIEALKHDGWVIVEPIKKGRFRRGHGLQAVWERTPWAKERENLHQHGGGHCPYRGGGARVGSDRPPENLGELVWPSGQLVNGSVND